MTLRIGLPQWQHPHWKQFGLETLADYAQLFDCVEGNTTLYALPKPEVVQRWYDMTHDDFRFCFKFPASISHQAALRQCDDLLAEFFRLLDPLANRIGQYWLQLPSTFAPAQLHDLWQFLDSLPRRFSYGVEVRHAAFFAKGEAERALNRGLQQRGVNRVILDSRPVHASQSQTAAAIEARRKKPRVPPHAVRTGQQPMVRFIGSDSVTESLPLFQPWQSKLAEWQVESDPLLFIHTPDMGEVFPLIQALWPQLQQLEPCLPALPVWPQQSSLF
ncbi:DUF72 domain-containing protein [Pantoea phytobeneficialis]|uniref:DUF72 domain-containing protein n=1 Tax=Pantoea phytobeneficialis TaxID=2052056 RepID=A0AAP9KQQ7_9GAMM|nr:DUF72 domain-containing protein [Pantoea phytobeneficialis]MDO6408621.1 DUF72 domain-containing protein [Pantoea phytobeneficialis]QGR08052.1 hypothetical protein CTZ24_17130 [Pantoea phytobeneficialis]